MTSELEKNGLVSGAKRVSEFSCAESLRSLPEIRFFDAFGIERNCCNNYEKETCPEKNCTGCDYYDYPEITDRILLELICLLCFHTRCDNVETLKEKVLTDLRSLLSYMRQVHHIPDKENDIYKKVRAVFGLKEEK